MSSRITPAAAQFCGRTNRNDQKRPYQKSCEGGPSATAQRPANTPPTIWRDVRQAHSPNRRRDTLQSPLWRVNMGVTLEKDMGATFFSGEQSLGGVTRFVAREHFVAGPSGGRSKTRHKLALGLWPHSRRIHQGMPPVRARPMGVWTLGQVFADVSGGTWPSIIYRRSFARMTRTPCSARNAVVLLVADQRGVP